MSKPPQSGSGRSDPRHDDQSRHSNPSIKDEAENVEISDSLREVWDRLGPSFLAMLKKPLTSEQAKVLFGAAEQELEQHFDEISGKLAQDQRQQTLPDDTT